MVSDNAAPTPLDAAAQRMETWLSQLNSDSGARISVENQAGKPAFGQANEGAVAAIVVQLELCDERESNDNSSREPRFELPYSVEAPEKVVVHQGESPGEFRQNLVGGGQIRKAGDNVELDLPEDERLVIDTKSGDVAVDSKHNYQKELRFEGSPWQTTIVSSDNNLRVTVGPQNVNSIERDGVMEIFPHSHSMQLGAEPRTPASEVLAARLSDNGRDDLAARLDRLDEQEKAAHESFAKSNGSSDSVAQVAESHKDLGQFLEKAADALPKESTLLDACAENQLRIALRSMREHFGSGTPETAPFARALGDYLGSRNSGDQQGEIDRLAFEARRGALMKTVIDNIENSPGSTYQTMAQDRAIAVRKSLISVHIAGGDPALKSFVKDVNERLDASVLIAPVGQDGPFHHGAIILTDEGATTYNGSFNLARKVEK